MVTLQPFVSMMAPPVCTFAVVNPAKKFVLLVPACKVPPLKLNVLVLLPPATLPTVNLPPFKL